MKHSGSDNKPEHDINVQNLAELATIIKHEKHALLSRWRERVRRLPSARGLDIPTLTNDVPLLIDELVYAFRSIDERNSKVSLGDSPPIHGLQRFEQNFDIVEVIAEYNILRGCVYDLAEENGFSLHGEAFHTLNRVFDEAISATVRAFITQEVLEVRQRRDEYLGFIVHDLRTPLNAISLAVKILESTPPEKNGAKTAQMLTILGRNVGRLEALIEKVLKESTYVQLETSAFERRELDLWPLVEALVYDLDPMAKTGGTKLINRVPKELAVYADAGMLRRVFQNLISKALKYTPRGEITIGARESGSGGAECWVSDNGPGIPREHLERVFDKPETTPGKEKRTTGLGLSIVKALVEAHGGQVTAESREGAGTTFRFTLPPKKEDETS